jgi:N-acetylmuramoyl-L-alanine amidase
MIRREDVSVYTEGESIAAKKISDLKERVRIVNSTDDAVLISIHQNTFSDPRYSGAQVFYATSEGSQKLARAMQQALVESLNPESNRKAKKGSSIYLLEKIKNTGVLVECGFLSNPEEEKKLRTDAYQLKLCCVIASVVCNDISN